jgi:CRP-like cAMP-binding protein
VIRFRIGRNLQLLRGSALKKPPRQFDPAMFLAKVGAGRTMAKFSKNQKLFAQGDAADAVFYIQKGKVKVTVVSEHGKEAVVAVLGADEFCGEGCLTGQQLRIATAAAMTDCEVMRIEKAAIARTLHDEPAFSEMFVAHLLLRTMRVEEDLVDQLFNSSEKRLARALLLLANFGKDGRPEPLIAKVSQETLAEMIGTTRSRVSFFMNKFRKLGFISYNGTMEVHSSLLSVVLNDQPHIRKNLSPGDE